jgi:hypothetical protein
MASPFTFAQGGFLGRGKRMELLLSLPFSPQDKWRF